MKFSKPVAISSQSHLNLCFSRKPCLERFHDSQVVPLLASEVSQYCSVAPVVFVKGDEHFLPMLLAWVEHGRNLLIDPDGGWREGSPPACLSQYPFGLHKSLEDEQEKLTLVMDEDYEGFNERGIGERLFDSEGNRTLFTQQLLDTLQCTHVESMFTANACERIAGLGLFKEGVLSYVNRKGKPASLNGFYFVDRSSLNSLKPEETDGLLKSGLLDLIYAHLFSLKCVKNLTQEFEVDASSQLTSSEPDELDPGTIEARNSNEVS